MEKYVLHIQIMLWITFLICNFMMIIIYHKFKHKIHMPNWENYY